LTPGDRLLPERIRKHLGTRSFGRRIYYLPETGSTNAFGLALARAGEASGTLVVADYQSLGRGRLDHQWWSSAGKDLLFSVILRPEAPPPAVLPVTLMFSAIISAELSGRLGADVSVEWPNDMVTQGGKIGGILAEGTATTQESAFFVVGVGVNVNSAADDFPAELNGRVATCRTVSGQTWDRAALLAGVLLAMESGYERFLVDGFEGVRPLYEIKLRFLGRRVEFERGGRRITATVEGVAGDGALKVRPDRAEQSLMLYGEEVWPLT
jgi:BirA family biotin operon repressor/biotin-[acetyl-CoA-carboxylase] ligase